MPWRDQRFTEAACKRGWMALGEVLREGLRCFGFKRSVILALSFLIGSWAASFVLYWLITQRWEAVTLTLYWKALWQLGSSAQRPLTMAGFAGLMAMGFAWLPFLRSNVPNLYGDAHFATRFEVWRAKLFAKEGILLGRAYGKALRLAGYEHVTLFAPTGTGKTTALTIPNLFSWEGSCIASDIKLTLFEHTSRYRREVLGQAVWLWNPGSPRGMTHAYNPLAIIGDNPYTRIDDIQKIAAILVPDNPKSEPIWQVQSRFLFVALVLYVLDTPNLTPSIGQVVKLVKETPDVAHWIDDQLQERDDLDPLCRANFHKFIELHEKTRLSILATFQSYFELFDNPLIEAATSRSDFDIRQLRRQPMTIYVGVTNDNLVRLSPLLTVFYQQVADVMTRQMPGPEELHGVLLLMDEFSALRRMESFHKNIGLYREYRLRVVIIIQELSQLYEIYGRDGAKVFINAKIRIAYTQNDTETCELIAKKLGDKTLLIKNESRQYKSGLLHDSSLSEAEHYVRRPLMLVQEIAQLPEDKALIMVQGKPPIYADKIQWFKESQFKEKMLGAIEIPSLIDSLTTDSKFNSPANTRKFPMITEKAKVSLRAEIVEAEMEHESLDEAV